MIMLTRLSGSVFALNSELIERIDSTPDTVITLVDGKKYVVAEGLEQVVDAVRYYRGQTIALGSHLHLRDGGGARLPHSRPSPPSPTCPAPENRHGEALMDPATLIGVLLAFVIIILANVLEGGNPMSLLLVAPMLLVFGATLMVTVAGGTLADAKNAIDSLKKAFTGSVPPAGDLVPTVVALAEKARREGLLALEDQLARSTTRSWSRASRWPSTAPTPRSCATSSRPRSHAKKAMAKQSAKFFADAGAYAPTIGIIGTVMGLVHVLENLAEPEEARPR